MFRSQFKTRKPARDSERQIKQELTRLCSMITRLLNPFCVLCAEGNWNKLETGHFWHRDMPPTEFDLDNLNTLCRKCNQRHEHDPQPYRDYMLLTLGERGFHDLAQKAHAQTKVGYVELLDMRSRMELLLSQIKTRVA